MRVAAREGLHAVSLRAVAAEAGISLRSVQYYFDTKARLMQSGLTALENISNERLSARLLALGPAPSGSYGRNWVTRPIRRRDGLASR